MLEVEVAVEAADSVEVAAVPITEDFITTKRSSVTAAAVWDTRNEIVVKKGSNESNLHQHIIPQIMNPKSDEDIFINNLAVFQQDLLDKGFDTAAENIHSEKARSFYAQILKAPPDVLDILDNGYYPTFVSDPPQSFFRRNNKSARDNLDFVR